MTAGRPPAGRRRMTRRTGALAATCAALFAALSVVTAQEAAPGHYDFLSFRRVPPTCPAFSFSVKCERLEPPPVTWRQFPDGRIEATAQRPLDLVRRAYGLEHLRDDFVQNAPRWMRNERYDVIGVVGTEAPPDRSPADADQAVRQLLRTSLSTHFALRVRTEPKERRVTLLTLPARSGPSPGVRPARTACRVSFTESTADDAALPPCLLDLRADRIDADGITMAQLGQLLSQHGGLGLLVFDETGLGERRFDIRLRRPASVPWGDAVEGALYEQLGLQLRPGKRSVPTLVIEHAREPDVD